MVGALCVTCDRLITGFFPSYAPCAQLHCVHCARTHLPILPQCKKSYLRTCRVTITLWCTLYHLDWAVPIGCTCRLQSFLPLNLDWKKYHGCDLTFFYRLFDSAMVPWASFPPVVEGGKRTKKKGGKNLFSNYKIWKKLSQKSFTVADTS